MTNRNLQNSETEIRFNQGQALLHLASTYPALQDVILELVQNSLDIDVKATRIAIKVNYKDRTIVVTDNGLGISVELMNKRLASVAERGRKGRGALGQFGLGMISALGKCERFTFTSCCSPHKNLFYRWVFPKTLVDQPGALKIQCALDSNLTTEENAKGMTFVPWRSQVKIEGFTKDEFISKMDIDELANAIRDRYAAVMRRNKVSINIVFHDEKGKKQERPNVTAPVFTGKQLEYRELKNAECGKIGFNMFVSRKTNKGRKGTVVMGVMGSDFRFPFRYFAPFATTMLREEVMDALNSGVFEGEILAEKVKLAPNRQTFVKDEPCFALCVAIEEWYDAYGKACLDEARQERQDERHQTLGLRALKVLEDLIFKNAEYASLLNVLKSFTFGTVGTHHTKVDGRDFGSQDENTLKTQAAPGEKKGEGNGSDGSKEPQEHKPDHVPKTVAGPKGNRRKRVKGHSTGLEFAFEGEEENRLDLWRLDTTEGVLYFNTVHPLWDLCQRKDTALIRLQEYIALQALTLQTMPETFRDVQRRAFDELMGPFVQILVEGDKVRVASPIPKKKSS